MAFIGETFFFGADPRMTGNTKLTKHAPKRQKEAPPPRQSHPKPPKIGKRGKQS